jgi:hypothetical protein
MLILLLERFGLIIALIGRWIAPAGEPGGEAITAGMQQCRDYLGGSCAMQAGGRAGVLGETSEAGPVENRVVLVQRSPWSSCELVGW